MKYFLQILRDIQILPVLMRLQQFPSLWVDDRIVVRRACTDDAFECSDEVAYGQIPELRKMVMDLFTYVGGTRLGTVYLLRVPPGGRIESHSEAPEMANYWHRHHICLQTATGIVFKAGNESPLMNAGEAWWVDQGKGDPATANEITNSSGLDMIHLVCDIKI